jgi:hypothetical protein
MTHPGYFTDSLSNQHWYRCVQCKYDGFDLDAICQHVLLQHGPIILPAMDIPLERWVADTRARAPLPMVRVGIGLLTWNIGRVSAYAARAVRNEVQRLGLLGVEAKVLWLDNGSDDDTVKTVREHLGDVWAVADVRQVNLGQCVARNLIIAEALYAKCDYLCMVDGDIELIPYSVFAMTEYLHSVLHLGIGCVGMYSRNCNHVWDQHVAVTCRHIEPWMVSHDPGIAWTNYGVFNMQMFRDGIRFDEATCFQGPGWGLEDDDLYLRMKLAGYASVNTQYFRHLHRRRHSSLKLLDPVLAAKVFIQRQAYLMHKYHNMPLVEREVEMIGRMTMPVLEY